MILLLLTEEIRNAEKNDTTFREKEKSVHPYAEFYTDAIVCSFKKWITTKDCIQPQQFALFLKKTIIGVSRYVCDQCPPDLTDEILS